MIVNELVERIVDCVMHRNGNHVIQRCIMSVLSSQLNIIVNALVGNVSSTVTQLCILLGTVVLMLVVVILPMALDLNTAVVCALQMYMLSIHPYGCRVMQRILENCTGEQMEVILSEILHKDLLLVSPAQLAI